MKKYFLLVALFAGGLFLGLGILLFPGILSRVVVPQYGVFILRSGDIYLGKIERFSRFALSDAWYFRVSQGATSTSQFLVSWERGTIWQPTPHLQINPSEVSLWSYVKRDSPLIRTLEEAKAQGKGVVQVQ